MIISCIGDSLTEGDYGVYGKRGIADVHKENYPYFLGENTGWTVRNFGKCGYRASRTLRDYRQGLTDVTGSDYILIMLGTNGGFSAEAETEDTRAYRELIALCREDAPGAKIVLMTPPHCTENPAFSNCGYGPRVRAAVAFVKKVAAEERLPLFDTAEIQAFTAANETLYQANDGLHFVESGYRVLAQFVETKLRALMDESHT